MNLRVKLSLTIGGVIVVNVLLCLFCLQEMSLINETNVRLDTRLIPAVIQVKDLSNLSSDFRRFEIQYVHSTTRQERSKYIKMLKGARKAVRQFQKSLAEVDVAPEWAGMVARCEQAWKKYLSGHAAMKKLVRQGKTDEAVRLLREESRNSFNDFSARLLEMVEIGTAAGRNATHESVERFKTARVWTLGALVIVGVLANLVGYLLVRSITLPLGRE